MSVYPNLNLQIYCHNGECPSLNGKDLEIKNRHFIHIVINGIFELFPTLLYCIHLLRSCNGPYNIRDLDNEKFPTLVQSNYIKT